MTRPGDLDTTGTGWTVQHGQAVWCPRRGGPELAGDLVLNQDTGGQFVVQFTKTPLPLVEARHAQGAWQIRFVPQKRTLSGRGELPTRFAWLVLPDAIQRGTAPPGWRMTRNPGGQWRLENARTGESLEGYLESD